MPDCLICHQPGATDPRYTKPDGQRRFVRGHVHKSCADAAADKARRRNKTREAKRWEEAGQQVMEFPSTT